MNPPPAVIGFILFFSIVVIGSFICLYIAFKK